MKPQTGESRMVEVLSTNRRIKRSTDPLEAIQFLLEALADRSDARAVALVHSNSRVVAGVGTGSDLCDLRALAEPVARGEVVPAVERLDAAIDVFSRPVAVGGATLYLAALGTRMRRFGDAAHAVARIASAGIAG